MRDIQRIFIHCTAGSQKLTLLSLLDVFKSKGWSAPGYHYVVFPNGKVEKLLDEDKISNGVQGYNRISINIAYVGGVDDNGNPVDNRTDAQKQAMKLLLSQLKVRYPKAVIMGHRDIWGSNAKNWKKYCPCFNAKEEYANIKPAEPAHPEIYVYKQEEDTNKLKKYAPWMN